MMIVSIRGGGIRTVGVVVVLIGVGATVAPARAQHDP